MVAAKAGQLTVSFAVFETETVEVEGQIAWFLIPSYFRTGGGR